MGRACFSMASIVSQLYVEGLQLAVSVKWYKAPFPPQEEQKLKAA